MKTSIDIPDKILADAMRYSRATTKREAVVTAMEDYVRRQRMAELLRHAGTCDDLLSVDGLERLRAS